MGMTYEQYWYGDPRMIRAYYEADRLRQERFNSEAWLIGAYVYEAVGRLTPVLHAFAKEGTKPIDYLSAPYQTRNDEPKEKTPEQEEREVLLARVYMTQFMEAGKNWGKH